MMAHLTLLWTGNRSTLLALVGIVGLYLVLGAVYAVTTPAFEKSDEEWHFAYISYLFNQGNLPPITEDETLNPAQQEAGQPPLYYFLSAGAARVFGWEVRPLALHPNPYWAYPAPGTVNDNKNRFVHEPNELEEPDIGVLYWLRGFSLLLGAGTVIGAYGIATGLTGSRWLGRISAATVAVLPQYLFVASSVSNDALVASLSSLSVWTLVLLLKPEAKLRLWIVFGVMAGLAALTKTNGLILLPVGVLAAGTMGLRRRSVRVAAIGVLATLGGAILLGGWWYTRNLWLYGDPLGLGIHLAGFQRQRALALIDLPSQWQAVEITFWAAFGWSNVLLPDWAYWGVRLAEGSALLGLVLVLVDKTRSRETHQGYWLVVVYVVGVGAAFAWWARTLNASLGRLLFPALAPLMVLMVMGWARLGRPWAKAVLAYLALVAIISPFYAMRAYQPPALLPRAEAPHNARPIQIDFSDLARLYAFDVSPRRVRPGEQAIVQLCWQALRATPANYSVFIHLLGPKDAIVGQRDTYPGLGSYATSLWRNGDAFCDRYTVPISSEAPGPTVYDLEVGLFDLATDERLPAVDANGSPLSLVIIDQIKVAGPVAEMPPSAVRFQANFGDQIAMLGYASGEARRGEHLPLTLYWQARAPVLPDYTVFLHVLDEGGSIVAQDDARPQAGRYPTSWWDNGEVVADTHTLLLPASLPPGTYRVQAGLYLLETGERLPLVGRERDVAELGTIRLQP